ncbi:MAG: AsmA-like C-terminal region-containing protein [Pseudomonadota bacterium]
MSVRRSVHSLLHIAAMPLVVVIVFAAAIAFRLTQGELALPDWAVDRIEMQVDRGLPAGNLSIGAVALTFDGEDPALRLRVSGVRLTEGDRPVLTLPDARVALDAGALLTGKLRPRNIAVEGVALEIGRDAEGRFTFGTGGGGVGALPTAPAAWLALFDAALASPVLAELNELRIDDVRVGLSDAITGLAQQIDDGTLTLVRNETGEAVIALLLRLPTRSATANLAVTLERGTLGAAARVSLTGVPLSHLAELLPEVPALTLVAGRAGVVGTINIADDGTAGPLRGRVELADAVLVDRPRLRLDRAAVGFDWDLGSDRIGLTDIEASSDDLSASATGQVILEEGVTGPIQMQLNLGETIFDPEDLLERRVEFESGLIETQLTQTPLALRIGQAMVTGPSGTARLSGRMRFEADGLHGALRAEIPRMAVREVVALWPPEIQVQARNWVTNNLRGGMAKDVTAAVRLEPGQPPEALANLGFEQATFRFMRFMPPAESATGVVQLDGGRLTARLDEGIVPALGPGDARTAETGSARLDGSRIVISDLTARPPRADVTVRAVGDMTDVLALLNNRPLRLLDRLDRTRTLASGQVEALITAQWPLRKGNSPADIDWQVEAALIDVETSDVVPGRAILADRLSLIASPAAVEITGDLTFEGVPFSGTWRQTLPPRSTVPIDPEAPPPPPGPPLDPGLVTGSILATPDGLARLGVRVEALSLRGEARADISIRLPPGQPAELTASSDLRGLAVALPALGWSKGPGTGARFDIATRLSSPPLVRSLSLDAPGLAAAGSISIRPNGTLDQARFDRVRTSWFDGGVTLTGRGAGAAPGITVRSGRADLRGAPFGQGDGPPSPAPLEVALNSLAVTDSISLTDLRASLASGQGTFTARINGGQPVAGELTRPNGTTTLRIRGANAGGVLQSAGLFRDARGGTLSLTLERTGQSGTYSGALRIRDVRVRDVPALASLLQTLSVVGILEQLTGDGLFFSTVESDFILRPADIAVRRASAVGPSMSITADGTYDLGSRQLDMQGVVSPIYLVNGLFGALFARQDEGLFGFTYRLVGSVDNPRVGVNPMSILTPGVFREIFRRPPPS